MAMFSDSKKIKNSTMEENQSTKSRLKTRNLNRPVISTRDPKEIFFKRPEPVQGAGMKGLKMEDESKEQEREAEVKRLKEKLTAAESTIKKLMKRDKEMTERLSIEVQRHVKQSGKFENLSQGGLRLTHLIERYEMLYSQGRLDALDELEELPQLNKMKKKEDIKHKIMAGIMVASHRICREYADLIRNSILRLLGVPQGAAKATDDHPQNQMELNIDEYLQSNTDKYNIEQMVKDVEEQLREILPEFPDLASKPHIASYICECVRLSWTIVNQTPPMEIEYTSERLSSVMHNRFHTSDQKNQWIKLYVWPTLVNSKDKNILSKGVVVT